MELQHVQCSYIPRTCPCAQPRPPHPPIKVVKPDWGGRSSSSASLKATWPGHAVLAAFFPVTLEPSPHLFPRRQGASLSSSRIVLPRTSHLTSCSIPSSLTALARLPGFGIQRRLPPHCKIAELPEFQFVIYSCNRCVFLSDPGQPPRPVSLYKKNIKITTMTISTFRLYSRSTNYTASVYIPSYR